MRQNTKTKEAALERALTAQQAAELVAELASKFGPRDAQINKGLYTSVRIERGWGISADVFVNMAPGDMEEFTDGTMMRCNPRIEISWSSTGRTVSQAQASIALYQEITNLAALIEARLAEKPIYSV